MHRHLRMLRMPLGICLLALLAALPAAAAERLAFTNADPDVLGALAAEGLAGGTQVDRGGYPLGELALDGNLAAVYAQDASALYANLYFDGGKDAYRFTGIAECAGLVEVSWPRPVHEAQIRSSVPEKGRWITQAAATAGLPTDRELFAVRGGVTHRVEIAWTGGSDHRGKAATFTKTVTQAVGCDQVVHIAIDALELGGGEGDMVEGEPSPLPSREASDRLLGQESQSGAAAPTSLVAQTCTTDDFNDLDLDGWTFSFIGDANQGGATQLLGRVQVTSDGTSFYHAPDNGGFLHRPVTGDFRAQIQLVGFPVNTGGGFRKTSFTVRAGLGADDPRVTIQYIPNHPTYNTSAMQFDYRDAAGVEHELASTPLGVGLPTHLMLERRGTVFSAYYSTDGGASWIRPLGAAGNGVTIAMPGTLELGMMNASYSATVTLTAEFDNFKVCSPAVVQLPPIPTGDLCAPGAAMDILYLLDSTGSMTFPFTGGGMTKLDAARQAIADMNDLIEASLPGSRGALVTFQGGFTPAYNQNNAVKVLSHLTTDFDALEAAAASIDVNAINPDATTPIAIALDRADLLFQNELDPDHQPVVVFIGDGWANIDLGGNGPGYYTFNEMSAISIGAYLPPAQVAWLGNFNGALGTYDGQVLADAMDETLQLKDNHPDLRMFTLGVHSNATFRPDLLGFMALYTGGDFYDVTSVEDMVEALTGIYQDVDCGADIGDRVWDDADGDGVQDPDEDGLEGVTVEVVDGGGDVVATATTGPDGEYLFENLEPGTYTVRVVPGTLPEGWGTPTFDYDGVGTPNVASVTVGAGDTFLEADFGYRKYAGAIGDLVWNDSDGDGLQDPGEPGLPGVTVELRGSADVLVGTAVTDGGGFYSFTGLGPDTYSVTVVPAGLGAVNIPTYDRDGIGTPHVAVVALAADQVVSDADFGYKKPAAGSIGDFVWNDLDGDGLQDPGEPGLAGVTVELRNSANTLIASVVTDGSGLYSFTGLGADTFTVTVVPSGLGAVDVPTHDRDGVATANVATVVLADDQAVTDADFGYKQPAAGSIGDRVWNDADGDGNQDPGETGLAGVTVELRNSSNVVIATTVTDGNGIYGFTGLAAGTYTVTVVPAGLGAVNIPTYDRDGVATANVATVVLATGQSISDADFGYKAPVVCAGSIGDRVWADQDQDGVQDAGENGIAGVTVELRNSSNVVIATTVTNSAGNYTFSGLVAGTYSVRIVTSSLPAGASQTYDADGLSSAHKTTLTLSCNQHKTNIDFGYRLCLGSIGNKVWDDKNGNGSINSGEPGLAGVTLELVSGTTVIATTTTNSSGAYAFNNVPAGTYTVRVVTSTLPAGSTPTFDRDGLSSPNKAVVTLTCCGDVSDADFGYKSCSSSIGDRVWEDKDGDRNQDSAEPGIAGVTVRLYSSSGTLLATTTTNSSGNYLFTGLANGTYKVKVDAATLPPGMAQTYDRDGVSSAHQATVTLDCCGSNVSNADFGYRRSYTFCPRSHGYWKTHQSEWPVSSLVIGGTSYNKTQLVAFLNYGGGDASKILARQLVATLLNIAAGSNPGSIADEVEDAHDLLDDYPPGSNPQGSVRTRALDLEDDLEYYNEAGCGGGNGC
jgi:hypothetical protein